jgi:hypothetical protein
MASLDHKIELALNEARILLLVTQVLVGFAYRATFEPAFDRLPATAQHLKLGALALELAVIAILELCAAYHIVVARGECTRDLQRFCSRAIELALFPFAVALGLEVFVVVEHQWGRAGGLTAGGTAVLVALWCWYGVGTLTRHRRRQHVGATPPTAQQEETMSVDPPPNTGHTTKLETRIEQVLIEARMVLPGVQALLGFQLASMLVEGFDKLPESSKDVHLASLGCIALAAILLMTPAAYHRIVEEGEDSERFFRVASRLVLAAMIPLALGIAGDFYVVAARVTASTPLALGMAALALAAFYGLWFGFTLYRRRQQHQTPAAGRSAGPSRSRPASRSSRPTAGHPHSA